MAGFLTPYRVCGLAVERLLLTYGYHRSLFRRWSDPGAPQLDVVEALRRCGEDRLAIEVEHLLDG